MTFACLSDRPVALHAQAPYGSLRRLAGLRAAGAAGAAAGVETRGCAGAMAGAEGGAVRDGLKDGDGLKLRGAPISDRGTVMEGDGTDRGVNAGEGRGVNAGDGAAG
jgi:hypothetical protein